MNGTFTGKGSSYRPEDVKRFGTPWYSKEKGPERSEGTVGQETDESPRITGRRRGSEGYLVSDVTTIDKNKK